MASNDDDGVISLGEIRPSSTSSRGGSGQSRQSSRGSMRSNHSNGNGLELRTGKNGSRQSQDSERSSTPKSVLPPINSQSAEQKSGQAMDRSPGYGESVPRSLRNFRRETTPDSSSSKGMKRSVSFVKENSAANEDDEDKTLQSLETQTDWDWVEDAMLDESVKIIQARKKVSSTDSDESDKSDVIPSIEKRDSSESLSRSLKEAELERLAQSDEEGQLPYPYSNDEYGIPILDLSSDTDDSSDDESRKPKQLEDKLLPSVGPPQILQYIRESEQEDLNSMNVEVGDLNTADYPQDDEGKIHGYFSGTCEFCQKPILAFPTTEQQQQQPPEELFCCEEYRKFIEFTIEGDTAGQPSKSLIDVKPHPHYGSKQSRKIAQQKAHQRMREREILRQQQNVALQNSGHPSNYQPPRTSKTGGAASQKDGQLKIGKALGMRALESTGVERPAMNALNFFAPAQKGMPLITTAPDGDAVDNGDKMPTATAVPPPTSIRDRSETDDEQKETSLKGEDFTVEKEEENKIEIRLKKPQKIFSISNLPRSISSSKESDLDSLPTTSRKEKKASVEVQKGSKKKTTESSMTSSSEVARQMKTINYQLSSQRCLEEGWTVRPPSPMLVNETDDVFVPEPLDSAFTTAGKMRKRELIQKYYESGEPFITIFPDGSGNVFYPTGRVAIVISCKEPGQYTYCVLDDYIEPSSDNPFGTPPQVLAMFQANGQASCSYTSGKLRLFLDQYGGIELDRIGAKKKKWTWMDKETHVHAPPFQPVCFSLTQFIAVRVMAQENISLTFRCGTRSCRLPVGAKLKLVAPENIPPKEIDESMLFINETKATTETLLHKISNLLRFPNSPKVEKMLPPLHITSKMHKNQKLREEQESLLSAAQAKANKPRPIRPVVVS